MLFFENTLEERSILGRASMEESFFQKELLSRKEF
jgi:hypothetical protein